MKKTQGRRLSAEAGGGSSYYAVASVDSAGDESAQSLGISPATIAAAAGGGAAGGGGCFVASVNRSIPKPWIWFVVLMGIGVAIAVRHRSKAHSE